MPLLDSIAFLIALFLIGGVLEQCGILSSIAEYILAATQQNPYLMCLSILGLSFLIATFLSAGPAAANFITHLYIFIFARSFSLNLCCFSTWYFIRQ